MAAKSTTKKKAPKGAAKQRQMSAGNAEKLGQAPSSSRHSTRRVSEALGTWLAKNRAALQLVDDWLEARAAGTCVLNVTWLTGDLKSSHAMPAVFGHEALRTWLRRHRADQYEAAL